MNYEFDVQLDEENLYDFMMYSNYKAGTGFLWPMVGVFAFVLALLPMTGATLTYRLIYAMFGAMFLFYIPFDLKRKSKKQFQNNQFYQKPIHYVLSDEGITTSQEEKESFASWAKFNKVGMSKRNIIVFMPNKSACIIPKALFGSQLAVQQAYDQIAGRIADEKKKARRAQ